MFLWLFDIRNFGAIFKTFFTFAIDGHIYAAASHELIIFLLQMVWFLPSPHYWYKIWHFLELGPILSIGNARAEAYFHHEKEMPCKLCVTCIRPTGQVICFDDDGDICLASYRRRRRRMKSRITEDISAIIMIHAISPHIRFYYQMGYASRAPLL